MQFLGIKVDEVSKEQALQKAVEFLNSSGQHKIFTPNPEIIVKAQKDEYFKKVLNSGDLNLCDGVGLWLATRLSFRPKRSGVEKSLSSQSLRDPSTAVGMTIERISGVDFMLELCQLAAEQGRGVYLLGSGSDEVVGGAFEQLEKKYPNLMISGYNKGPEIGATPHISFAHSGKKNDSSFHSFDSEISENPACKFDGPIFEQINQSGAQILFVAFGMGKQEKWIYENISKMPGVKIAMGVGGSFDFISGKVKRAPLFLRHLGLEWLYRLVQQPSRIGRIFNATLRFTWLVLFNSKI